MKMTSFAVVLIGLLIAPVLGLNAQNVKADDVLGIWSTAGNESHVEIYKKDGKYYGKIIWLKFPIDSTTGKPKLDTKNPDPALRSRPVLGLNMLSHFVYDKGDEEWKDGEIYDPKHGKTYSCYMEFPDKKNLNRLKIRGYVGFSLFGRTVYWQRVPEKK